MLKELSPRASLLVVRPARIVRNNFAHGGVVKGFHREHLLEEELDEGNQGSGDDTSLNAVQLDCQVPFAAVGQTVSSHDGLWGGWGSTRYCSNARSWAPSNFISGARIRIESSQGGGDDTAANDVTFLCRDGDTINPGNGRAIGSWSSYAECPSASLVCGVTARIEDPRGSGDDTAMNGIRLKCCSAP